MNPWLQPKPGCRKFDNEDKCLSHSGAWPLAKKFVTQIFTLIMPIKSMISLLSAGKQANFGPPTGRLPKSFDDKQMNWQMQ